jgi:hypothetical protein
VSIAAHQLDRDVAILLLLLLLPSLLRVDMM